MEAKEESPFVPFVRKWDGYDHYHFISWSHRYYSRVKHEARPYPRFYMRGEYKKCLPFTRWDMWDTAERLFKVGKKNYVLDLDFQSFWQKLDPIETKYNYYDNSEYSKRVYKRSEKYSDYYPMDGAHFRCRVPLKIVGKKVLSENDRQKREWRKEKGFDRDKAHHGWRHRGKPNRYGKQLCNREYRRHVTTVIRKGQYHKLTKTRPKDYFDPWRFD